MEKKKVIKEFANAISTLNLESELNLPAKTIAEYLFKQLDLIISIHAEKSYVATLDLASELALSDAVEVKKENTFVNDFVDRMYEIYPNKCPKRNASTGKSHKDKERIKRLLKLYSEEQIEQVIRSEVENNLGINYMKNFSTFLNNFPAPVEEASRVETNSNELWINGVKYQ